MKKSDGCSKGNSQSSPSLTDIKSCPVSFETFYQYFPKLRFSNVGD